MTLSVHVEDQQSPFLLTSCLYHVLNFFQEWFAKLYLFLQQLAQYLEKKRYIYLAYGALDGCSLVYSLLRLMFDITYTHKGLNSGDCMHDWMLTPVGITFTIIEMILLVSLAAIGNYFKDDDPRSIRYIAILWPHLREIIKGLKNSYKGTQGLLFAIHLIAPHFTVYTLMLPLGLAISGANIISRIIYRNLMQTRKLMQDENAALLNKVLNEILSPEEWDEACSKIQTQSLKTRTLLLCLYTLNGASDSLYFYFGVFAITGLTTTITFPLAVILLSLCVIYSVGNIIKNINDELEFQRKLNTIAANVEWVIYTKKNEEKLYELISSLDQCSQDSQERTEIETEIKAIIQGYQDRKKRLQSLLKSSLITNALLGSKNGLTVYSVISISIFAVATVLMLSTTLFPPIAVVLCASLGVCFMAILMAYSILSGYTKGLRQAEEDRKILKQNQLLDINKLKTYEEKQLYGALENGMCLKQPEQSFFYESLEALRSLVSGLIKGLKGIEMFLNPCQIFKAQTYEGMPTEMHYQDTPWMLILACFSSIIFGAIMALRALARGFGREPVNLVIPQSKYAQTFFSPASQVPKKPTSQPEAQITPGVIH